MIIANEIPHALINKGCLDECDSNVCQNAGTCATYANNSLSGPWLVVTRNVLDGPQTLTTFLSQFELHTFVD